jgi:transcriptional regulator GlxA family with amidase domain
VRTDRGLRIDVPGRLDEAIHADTVLVPPPRTPDEFPAAVLRVLRTAHERGARVVSLCTGAFVLAAAGLLDGRRATTHWEECPELARRYPQIDVDPDVLYIDDGDVLTSAGSAASLDLCLQIVRSDYGTGVAADLARELVVPPHRDGGQAQYIRTPLPDPQTDELFTGTLTWLQEHLDEQVSVTELARRSAMSRRTFARRFADSTGTTPYRWLLRQRVQLAQRLLEETDESVEAIASRTGFVTAGNLRKHFARFVNTTPLAYRRAFVTTAKSA